jgi:phage shock protein PspC (stress-responsive transcriptional regulator)
VVWVLGTLFSAAFPGIFLYLALWYLLPKEPPPAPAFDPPPLQPWKKTT